MGDIADMMLEGVLCEGCGEFLGDGDGYPTKCQACRDDEEELLPGLTEGVIYCERCLKGRHFNLAEGKGYGVRMRRVKKGILFVCKCGHKWFKRGT